MKKLLVGLFLFSSLFGACDCSAPTAYEFSVQMKILQRAYRPLAVKLTALEKTVDTLLKEKQKENARIEKLIPVLKNQAVYLNNIAFITEKNVNNEFLILKTLTLNIPVKPYSVKK